MIITENKPFQEVIDSLSSYTRIFLVGCGECATACKTGGELELEAMKEKLGQLGKHVVGMAIPNAPCVASQIKSEFVKHIKAAAEAEAFLVFACGLGVQGMKDNKRNPAPAIPALNTLCVAVKDAQGDFFEKCALCGECVLDTTAAICPMAQCPKGILNGPCGGMDKGKCEVNRERDCVWGAIYQELEKTHRVSSLRAIRAPKNHNKTTRPQRFNMAHRHE
jgi:hypothetical protein